MGSEAGAWKKAAGTSSEGLHPTSPRVPSCLFLASRVTLFSCIGEPLGNRSIPSVISESSSDGKAPSLLL